VYSEPGHGTTFKVYLPSLDKTVPVALPQAARTAVKGAGTVLLVEDEPALRVLAVESLNKLGYTVLQAGNGLEALAVVEQHPAKIDVVIADIVMPRMGGPELIEKLRAKRDDFAVIFMTGYTEASVLENARIGSDAVLLHKPFSVDVLAAKINELQQKASSDAANGMAAGSSR
jgi:CheY-like chemotaxis protein